MENFIRFQRIKSKPATHQDLWIFDISSKIKLIRMITVIIIPPLNNKVLVLYSSSQRYCQMRTCKRAQVASCLLGLLGFKFKAVTPKSDLTACVHNLFDCCSVWSLGWGLGNLRLECQCFLLQMQFLKILFII